MVGFLVLGAAAQAEKVSRFPNVTPRELVVQLNDESDPRESSVFGSFRRRFDLVAAERLLEPKPTADSLRRRLERTWTLRYRRNVSPEDAVAECLALENVLWAEPNYLYRTLELVPNDPQYVEQWSLPLLQMPKAWSVERGSPSVVIAVVDTGAELTHPDLRDQLWRNPHEIPDNGLDDDDNGFADDLYGWDFVDALRAPGKGDFTRRDNDPADETGHGTHVAGIVAARPNNGIGIAGVAWGCRLMVLRAGFAARDDGTLLQGDDSAAAILYAVENGASVVNLSWGDEHPSFLLRDVVRYAYEREVVLVGATGNDNRATVAYPAAYPEVLSVGASDQNDDAAYFTNGHAGVDVAAPGMVILSLGLHEGLRTLSGTSMAAPHVAGIVGLMRSKRRALRVETIRAILKTSADPLQTEGRLVGVGRVNAYRSLLASATVFVRFVETSSKFAADRSFVVEGNVSGAEVRGYRLFYGETETPSQWRFLAEVHVPGRRGTLYTWDTSPLREGVYSLRLEAFDRFGRTFHDQALVVVDHSAPRVLRQESFPALHEGRVVSLFWFETDDEVSLLLDAERLDGNEKPLTVRFERARRFLIPAEERMGVGRWRYRFRATNAVGKTTEVVGELEVSQRVPNPATLTPFGDRRPPALDVALSATDFDGDGEREIVGGTPGTEGFRVTQVYEFSSNGRFRPVYVFREPFTPLDAADADGDGKPEVLGLRDNELLVLEAATEGGYPSREVGRFPGVVYARFGDVTGEGLPEILARRDAAKVAVFTAGGDDRFVPLPLVDNPSGGRNLLADALVVEDFDGDGLPELAAADSEGEVLLWRHEGGRFSLVGVFPSRYRNAKALASGMFEGRKGLMLVAEDVYDPVVPRARLLTVALFLWNSARRTLEEVAALSVLEEDKAPSVLVARTTPSASDSVALLAAGYVYLLRPNPRGFSLAWSSVASPTRFALTDLSGDGLAEILFASGGVLNLFSDVPSPDVEVRPFALRATPVDGHRVRLSWQTELPTDADVYRSQNGVTFKKLATVSGARDYLDETVQPNTRYFYEVRVGESRSLAVAVFVGEPPKLVSARALSPRWVSVRFSLPMGDSAREPHRYRFQDEGGRVREPSSIVSFRDEGRELLLALEEDLENGSWRLTVVHPRDVTSRDAMPLSEEHASTTFTVAFEASFVSTLRELRVYPNPVFPARHHVAVVVFDRLPSDATVRIFDAAGALLVEGRPDSNGRWLWNLLNDASRPVGSGIYLYEVFLGSERRLGKLAVVR